VWREIFGGGTLSIDTKLSKEREHSLEERAGPLRALPGGKSRTIERTLWRKEQDH